MSKKFILPQRQESHERYEANRAVNTCISESFHASMVNVVSAMQTKVEVDFIPSNMVIASDAMDIPYGSSTLGVSGCAVFCVHDALTYARRSEYEKLSIREVAQEVANKGYYEPGKGTYHNLFDHLGARRATDVQDIFDALCKREHAIVTFLVDNAVYNGRDGRHFINAVYYKNGDFIINDSSIGVTLAISAKTILQAVDIAWIW